MEKKNFAIIVPLVGLILSIIFRLFIVKPNFNFTTLTFGVYMLGIAVFLTNIFIIAPYLLIRLKSSKNLGKDVLIILASLVITIIIPILIWIEVIGFAFYLGWPVLLISLVFWGFQISMYKEYKTESIIALIWPIVFMIVFFLFLLFTGRLMFGAP